MQSAARATSRTMCYLRWQPKSPTEVCRLRVLIAFDLVVLIRKLQLVVSTR